MQLLKQEQNHPMKQHEQVILLVAALNHVMQEVPPAKIGEFRKRLLHYIKEEGLALCQEIDQTGGLTDETRQEILRLSREFLKAEKEKAQEGR